MRDVSASDPSPEPDKKRSIFTLAPISDAASARKAAKHGAVAGLFFAGMYLLGGALVYFGRSPVDGAVIDDPFDIYGMLVVDALLIALILFLSWRTSTGRGWISSIVLLLWFLGEIAVKLLGGSGGIGWIIFYIVLTLGFIDGVRGSLAGRKYAVKASSPSATPTAS